MLHDMQMLLQYLKPLLYNFNYMGTDWRQASHKSLAPHYNSPEPHNSDIITRLVYVD